MKKRRVVQVQVVVVHDGWRGVASQGDRSASFWLKAVGPFSSLFEKVKV